MNKKRGLRKALSSELITDYEKREGHAQNSFNSIYKRDSPDGGDGGSDGGSIGLCKRFFFFLGSKRWNRWKRTIENIFNKSQFIIIVIIS